MGYCMLASRWLLAGGCSLGWGSLRAARLGECGSRAGCACGRLYGVLASNGRSTGTQGWRWRTWEQRVRAPPLSGKLVATATLERACYDFPRMTPPHAEDLQDMLAHRGGPLERGGHFSHVGRTKPPAPQPNLRSNPIQRAPGLLTAGRRVTGACRGRDGQHRLPLRHDFKQSECMQ